MSGRGFEYKTILFEFLFQIFNYNFCLVFSFLRSMYHLTMLATPHLIESKGNVVNISSVNGMRSVGYSLMTFILSFISIDLYNYQSLLC